MFTAGVKVCNRDQFVSMLPFLPVELLMYLLTFVTSTRDRVSLWLVSCKFRSIMEIPSLWREFCWSLHEEQSIVKVLKSCGRYIETLSFPDHVPSPAPAIISQYCNHVTTLSVPCGLQPAMFKMAVTRMEGLQRLDIGWSTDMSELLLLSDSLSDVTIRVQYSDRHNIELDEFLKDWIKKGFVPENLNIICKAPIW